MKKYFLFLFGVLLIGLSSSHLRAQSTLGISYGVNAGVVLNELNSTQMGINFYGKYPVSNDIMLGASFGYYSNTSKYQDFEEVQSFEPFVGLIEYHFDLKYLKPYVGLNIGSYLEKSRIINDVIYRTITDHGLLLGAVVGGRIDISTHFKAEFNAKLMTKLQDEVFKRSVNLNVGIVYVI